MHSQMRCRPRRATFNRTGLQSKHNYVTQKREEPSSPYNQACANLTQLCSLLPMQALHLVWSVRSDPQEMAIDGKTKTKSTRRRSQRKARPQRSSSTGKWSQRACMSWWKGTQYWLHLLAIDRYQVRNSLANICFDFIALIWGYHHLGKDMYDIRHKRKDLQQKKS